MRNYAKAQEAASLALMTGAPMTDPCCQISAYPGGATLELVHALPSDDGEPQAALGTGGFGMLRRAGKP